MIISEDRIEIPFSKPKLALLLLGSLGFVAAGLWFVISPPVSDLVISNPLVIAVVGYAAILFFGFAAVHFIRRLLSKQPGLIIDNKGFLDNSAGASAGYVFWADIETITVTEVQQQKLIMVRVKTPQAYIDKQQSAFKRKAMQLNNRMYGAPVSISANALRISFDELLKTLTEKWTALRYDKQD